MQTQPTSGRTIRVKMPGLYALQQQIAHDSARMRVAVCGRRWGKTRLGVTLGLQTASRGGRAYWVAPIYAQASIAWRLAAPMAARIPRVKIKEADRVIILPTGGEFWFKSSDRADNLRGESLDLAVLDEADFQAGEVWEQVLRPSLADRQGRAVFISTPNRENGWFHELFKLGQRGEPGWKSWQLPSWSNPYLDPAEIEAAKQSLPSLVFRREFGAEFVSTGGARLKREWLRHADSIPSGLDIAMGVDLAISTKDNADYTAAVVLGRVPLGKTDAGRLYVLDAARTRASFHEVLKFIQDMATKWHPSRIAIEQVQYQAAVIQTLLRDTKLPVQGIKPDKDKVSRFMNVEARYEQGLVYHTRSLPREFEDELLSFPVGMHDDWADALAYAHLAVGPTIAEQLQQAMARAFAT